MPDADGNFKGISVPPLPESMQQLPTEGEWLEQMHERCDPAKGISCPLCER